MIRLNIRDLIKAKANGLLGSTLINKYVLCDSNFYFLWSTPNFTTSFLALLAADII